MSSTNKPALAAHDPWSFELTETPAVEVAQGEYVRLLGFPPGSVLEGRAAELASASRSWYARNGRPWIFAREVRGLALRDGKVWIGCASFASTRLYEQFSLGAVERAVLAVVSAGPECEARARELWTEEKPDEYFFLEVFGSAVAEHLVTLAGARLCHRAERQGFSVLPHYSPGYTGWDVADQVRLFGLLDALPGGRPRLPGPLTLRETGRLEPKKSLLALFGLSRGPAAASAHAPACAGCAFARCEYRRAPYAEPRSLFEEVAALQQARKEPTGVPEPADLERPGRYTLNQRTLRKWSAERLQLKALSDGTIQASFVYDGTTCSNMGRALQFIYRIELAPASEGYTIRRLSCGPTPGDTGHQFMCAWLRDPNGTMQAVNADQPLVGRPLNEVLSWSRIPSPSGCYCEAASRLHKWGLVLEVLHFALAHDGVSVTPAGAERETSGQSAATCNNSDR